MSTDTEVVIVGAGPTGLITALRIAQEGISVTVLELHNEVIQSPRAMGYGPAGVVELERAGIAQECREIGMGEDDYSVDVRWITIENKIVCSIQRPRGTGFAPVVCGQHKVAEVILKRLEKFPHAKVVFNHQVVGVEDHGNSVTAVCKTPEGEAKITGKWLVGADGARSTVRKLIGCTFDGFTYDKMVVATNVYYPFRENGFGLAQFIIDPENFALVLSSPP
jgi:2-polyprenyl-6-methoxyphenol hydroxylase-like FAD-dependent oxidoreductase